VRGSRLTELADLAGPFETTQTLLGGLSHMFSPLAFSLRGRAQDKNGNDRHRAGAAQMLQMQYS